MNDKFKYGQSIKRKKGEETDFMQEIVLRNPKIDKNPVAIDKRDTEKVDFEVKRFAGGNPKKYF